MERKKIDTIEELLHDERFIDSIVNPTTEKKNQWAKLIEEGAVSQPIYDEACEVVVALNKRGTIAMDAKSIDNLWQKIDKTNRTSIRRKRIYLYASISSAACVAIIAILSVFNVGESGLGKEDYFAMSDDVEKLKQQEQIQLVLSDARKVELDSDEAIVDYSQDGKIKINEEEIDKQQKTMNQLVVPYGKRSSLVLSDGSKIWVNAGTHVIYPTEFAGKQREIFVNGEVYAEITKDEKRPFYIKSTNMDVRVLGTSFNMKDYESDENKSVVLVSGSVEVNSTKNKKKTLKPSQEFYSSPDIEVVREVDISEHIAWIRGIYSFKNRELKSILQYLSNYYGIEIVASNEIQNIRCSGGLDLKEDLNRVLLSLTLAAPIEFSKQNEIYKFVKKRE